MNKQEQEVVGWLLGYIQGTSWRDATKHFSDMSDKAGLLELNRIKKWHGELYGELMDV